jgi:hypothetical protein
LLIYDAATGGATFFDVWGPGNINPLKSYTDWSPGHTHIVPGNFGGTSRTGQTDLLIYDAATGGATFFDVWGQGNINPMKSYTDWSPGHTHILPGNFGGTNRTGHTDVLIYGPGVGPAGFFDVWGQGNVNPEQPAVDPGAGRWSLMGSTYQAVRGLWAASGSNALVLSGGGSQGDFEVGVVRYLFERAFSPGVISSASVGSVNAVKLVENENSIDPTGLERIWLNQLNTNTDMYTTNGAFNTQALSSDVQSLGTGWLNQLAGLGGGKSERGWIRRGSSGRCHRSRKSRQPSKRCEKCIERGC